MTKNRRSRVVSRFAALWLLTTSVSGCLSEVTSSVRETPGAPLQQLRLVRVGASPIAGTFRQEGHAIVGQLTLSNVCNAETIQRIKRQEVTDTHTNRSAAIGWLVAGGVLAALGTGLLVASGDADQQVTCGEHRAGDKCMSKSGALQELGLTTLLSGLVLGAPGGVFLARDPKLETKDLPDKQLSRVTAQHVPCAPAASLEGVVVAVELAGNGRWSGRSAGDGSVRIEVQPTIPMPEGATVQVLVQSVPPLFTSSVALGTVLGEVHIEKQKASFRPAAGRDLAKR